ncbi:hypothetical protein ACHOLT_12365 [Desulfitobacterium sp. Sab5]|uniref:hypothetical protein n=1 Tax=Desulfitobacterium nosdiversum TaxID=3375356 RepID=UPI003CFA383A
MAEGYICPFCGIKSTSDQWSITTWKFLHREAGPIFNIARERSNWSWVCPHCRKTSTIEEILAAQDNI